MELGYKRYDVVLVDFGKEFNSVMQTEQGKKEIEDSFQAALNALFYDRPEYFFLESTKMFFYTETTTRGTKTTYETYIAPPTTHLEDLRMNTQFQSHQLQF